VGLETFNLLYLILEGIFGEDINDASLNLGAGAFIIRINIMSLFQSPT
jgi:hypothetical protein